MTGRDPFPPLFRKKKKEKKNRRSSARTKARVQSRGEAETPTNERVIHIAGWTSIFIPLVDGTAEERRRRRWRSGCAGMGGGGQGAQRERIDLAI